MICYWWIEHRYGSPEVLILDTPTCGTGCFRSDIGKPVISEGPIASGPIASGPVASGPIASGPIASGPIASGPIASGPISAGGGVVRGGGVIARGPILAPGLRLAGRDFAPDLQTLQAQQKELVKMKTDDPKRHTKESKILSSAKTLTDHLNAPGIASDPDNAVVVKSMLSDIHAITGMIHSKNAEVKSDSLIKKSKRH